MPNHDDKILRLVELARAHGATEEEANKYLDELQGLSLKRIDAELAKAEKAEAMRQADLQAEKAERAAKAAEAQGLARCRVLQRLIHAGTVHEPGSELWLKPTVIAARPDHLKPL